MGKTTVRNDALAHIAMSGETNLGTTGDSVRKRVPIVGVASDLSRQFHGQLLVAARTVWDPSGGSIGSTIMEEVT